MTMINRLTVTFLILSSAFAGVHHLAMTASLYWYYSWFDVMMHFWGGLLLGLGVHVFSNIKWLHIKPTLITLLTIIFIATISWEVFEWFAGLYDPETHTLDTAQDILLGFSGGLLAHFTLQAYTME